MLDNTQRTGFIFRCTNSTEDECFNRMLFGENYRRSGMVRKIKKGDPLFLCNVTTGKLYGEFVAKSDGRGNIEIEKDAWGGGFPLQVRVDWKKKHKSIFKENFREVISWSYGNRFPQSVISSDQVQKLREILEKAESIPPVEVEFRKKFPANIFALDGHCVRSHGEENICNWLFFQDICHGYERKLPVKDNAFCDFFFHLQGKKGFVYIEYWGMEDQRYKRRKERKLEIYKENNLSLIELTSEDLEHLDDVLPKKLRPFLKKDHKFI